MEINIPLLRVDFEYSWKPSGEISPRTKVHVSLFDESVDSFIIETDSSTEELIKYSIIKNLLSPAINETKKEFGINGD